MSPEVPNGHLASGVEPDRPGRLVLDIAHVEQELVHSCHEGKAVGADDTGRRQIEDLFIYSLVPMAISREEVTQSGPAAHLASE